MNKISDILVTLLIFSSLTLHAQSHQQIIYKTIDTIELTMDIYTPAIPGSDGTSPAMVFFFGGGWTGGSPNQFEQQALYFSKRGIVCILADYRVFKRHQTSPFASLEDAKSAIRYVRQHASRFHIDPAKICAAGGSAGGHLAAATALINDFNDSNDDLTVSCIPDALVLFNPVIDNGPGGYGYSRIGDDYHRFSPIHNIKEGAPPTLIMVGSEDGLIPVPTVRYYQTVMEKVGSRCDLKIHEGQAHGFFNFKSIYNYHKTVMEADEFLTSIGFLEKDQAPNLQLR